MKIRKLLPFFFAATLLVPVVACNDDDDDYDHDYDYAQGVIEINDVDCVAGYYLGYAGWDVDRQEYILPLTYRFTRPNGIIVDGYFTFTFDGVMPKVGDDLTRGRNFTMSTDGVNRLPYRKGSAKVKSVDYINNRITIEYDDLEMGALVPDPMADFQNAGSYEIDGWQTVSFDLSTGPGVH